MASQKLSQFLLLTAVLANLWHVGGELEGSSAPGISDMHVP